MIASAAETTVSVPQGFDRTAFESFLETRDEPGWVSDFRRKAFEVYQEACVLPLDPEEWKRIDLRAFRPEEFAIRSQRESSAELETLMQNRAKFSGHISHVDGHCVTSELEASLKSQSIEGLAL